MKGNYFTLIFNGNPFQIPSNFKHREEISLEIREILTFDVNHQYHVKSNVSEAVFQSFTDYLKDDKPLNIQKDNFLDFIRLSKEFGILGDVLEAKKKEFGELFVNIMYLDNQQDEKIPLYEELISEDLDCYLQNYGEKLMNAPIQSVYNIFKHEKRKLIDHDLAYNQIKKHYEDTDDMDIFILLDLLDGTKLSKENLEEAISLQDERCCHMPRIDFTYVSSSVERQNELEKRINMLELRLSTQKSNSIDEKNIQKMISEAMSKIQEEHSKEIEEIQAKHSSELQALHDELLREIEVIKEGHLKELNDVNEKHNKEIEDIKDEHSKEIENIKNDLSNELNVANEKHNKEIEDIKNELSNELNVANENHNKEIEDIKDEHSKEVENIKNELSNELNDANEKYNKEIEDIKDGFSKEIEGIKEEHSKEIKAINEAHSTEIQEMQDNFEVQIQSMKDHINERWEKIEDKLKNSYLVISNFETKPITIEPSENEPGIFSTLKKKETNLFDHYFIASSSSSDIYNLIDPNTQDFFTSTKSGNLQIKIVLKDPIVVSGFQIFTATKNFPKSFYIEINNNIKVKTSASLSQNLNSPNTSVILEFPPVECKTLKFFQIGKSWSNEDFIHIRRIELISPEAEYSKGVFRTLVDRNENNDPHKCPVFITSSCFHFNTFFSLNSKSDFCTNNKQNSWFQVELTKGAAIITGFRIKISTKCKIKSFKIICSNDEYLPEDKWLLAFEDKNVPKDGSLVKLYSLLKSTPPVKFIRLVQTEKNYNNDFFLMFYHFDVFGTYI